MFSRAQIGNARLIGESSDSLLEALIG